MLISYLCSIFLLFGFLQTTTQPTTTSKPVDPTTVEPRDADVVPSIDDARKHLGAPASEPQIALWLSERDPEILFIAVRLDKPRELIASSGGDNLTMRPVGDPKDLIFAAASRQPAWKQATTNVWVGYKDDKKSFTVIGPKNAKGIPESPVWRGVDAPRPPEEARELKGEVRKYEVPSEALGETRRCTVYLPPGYDPTKPLPTAYNGHQPAVIYFGDGGVVDSMAHIVEPLITSGKIRPVVMVGAHNSDRVVRPPNAPAPVPTTNPSEDPFANDPRGMEYLTPHDGAYGANETANATHVFMFDRHFTFFADELPKWAEDKLGVSDQRDERLLSGFSNSAGFVVTLIRQRPMQYGGVIANSVAGGHPPTDKNAEAFKDLPENAPRPKFSFSSGSWEKYFGKNTGNWDRYMKKHGAKSERIRIVGGHDQAIWEINIARALPWMLPPHDARQQGK